MIFGKKQFTKAFRKNPAARSQTTKATYFNRQLSVAGASEGGQE